jgi:transcriptional regulatory protein RtcR
MAKPIVVIGLLGISLDHGRGTDRWEKWRPTISLCQHEDMVVSRFELLTQRKFTTLSDQVVADLAAVSPETRVRPHLVEFEDAWDFQQVYGALHDWTKAYPFNPEEEEYLVHITTGSHVAQICLFLLTESHYLPGKLLQTSPPNRSKPGPGCYEIIDLDLSKYDRLATRFQREQTESLSFLKSGIETRNRPFNQLIERIEKVAIHSSAPLLLMGPTGSGKSHLARRIYELKKSRRQVVGEFVEVNCATLRGDGAMSALFGHKKGSFTGALQDRPGLLRVADNGVLFLDEVGELGLDEQAMLLRALEEKRFLPVGSDKEVRSDFQLIAGTNRDLSLEVRERRFREDLLARINVWTFKLPALRDRREDIEPNLRYELEQYAARTGTNIAFNKEARERFLAFAQSAAATWGGNFRDLNAAVTRMATLAGGGRITADVVDDEVQRLQIVWGDSSSDGIWMADLEQVMDADALQRLDLFDRVQLAEVVRVCRGARSLSDAGRLLFAASRRQKTSPNDADRLRKYLARFGIDWRSITTSPS